MGVEQIPSAPRPIAFLGRQAATLKLRVRLLHRTGVGASAMTVRPLQQHCIALS